ncbi:phosphatidylserine decarboxylase family protein [Subtercola frigoramans]|uniref:Phosphatidylserine decarboxylase n=1 Tax=Subtercola frigoramans TaxID=120298 RepID=A0ABS2L0H9_9MICO|nr:phosphatidylserine decarboxylase family protein [Subtercola frigoramans]MBM7470591.1 phosphatidylserine decarboxylase [Subtercola frigoramans]
MSDSLDQDVRCRAGWLPANQDALENWLAGHCERVEARGDDVVLHPVIREFQHLIDTDPVVRVYMNEMIDQVPPSRKYSKRHVTSVDQLLRLVNEVLTIAPEFGADTMVMTPLTAILDWTMGTPAGLAAYRDTRINTMLKKILDVWCEFLSGPDSRYVINDSPSGWKSPDAQRAVGIEQFEYDPDEEYWGFASWNDFFTRRLKAGERPVAAPDDPSVITSACESTPYAIRRNVQRRDTFWIKRQPYSLEDMLANDPAVDELVGGTVYQGFLSATNYHRWHSPVTGTIVRAFVEPGTYYSEADSEGPDAVEPGNSQGYLAHVATRAIIILKADNPAIGTVAFIAVGMLEVSSCIIHSAITSNAHVNKGDEIGYFQFGGSTECLIFRPGAIKEFALQAIPQPHDSANSLVPVNSRLATAQTG